MLTREQFQKYLRETLNHLYDPQYLRRSPLATLFSVADRFDTSTRLQNILTEAIESLNPDDDETASLRNKQFYELLLYRYVEQFSQKEVADQFGISVRHLRREQDIALEMLGYQLWEQFQLETEIAKIAEPTALPAQAAVEPESIINDEFAWLKNVPPEDMADLQQTLPEVLKLARSLANQHGVRLDTRIADDLPAPIIHRVALRQILLNLLTVAVHRSPGGQVIISAGANDWEIEIELRCIPRNSPAGPFSGSQTASLELTQQMVNISGGELTFSGGELPFRAMLKLPALEQMPVLVIDDNVDTLQLLQRYSIGTRYRLITSQDPKQLLPLIDQLQPQIVVLDVMMPQLDGWELLGRLRHHPVTEHIPIIVCTILPQQELALSLGADAFIPKPIQRQEFLTTLDRQVEAMAT